MNGTVFLVAWVSAIAVGMLIGGSKGRMGVALALTIILGWIGVVILAFVPTSDARKIERRRHQLWIEEQARGTTGSPQPYPPRPELPRKRGGYTTEEIEDHYRRAG